jgi:hypothetical protein
MRKRYSEKYARCVILWGYRNKATKIYRIEIKENRHFKTTMRIGKNGHWFKIWERPK